MSEAKLENVQRENKLFKVEILRRTRKILNIISRFLDILCLRCLSVPQAKGFFNIAYFLEIL